MPTNPKWTAYKRKMQRLGTEITADERFLPYFRTKQRIKVRLADGEIVTGTVHGSDGSLVLRRRLNSRLPDDALDAGVELLAVLRGEDYIEIDNEGAKT